jgi:hypothetical protein
MIWSSNGSQLILNPNSSSSFRRVATTHPLLWSSSKTLPRPQQAPSPPPPVAAMAMDAPPCLIPISFAAAKNLTPLSSRPHCLAGMSPPNLF